MNKLNRKLILFISMLLLFGQQNVFADGRSHSHRNAHPARHAQKNRIQHKPQTGYRSSRPYQSTQNFKPYYKSGHQIHRLPKGYSRAYLNAKEYFFFEGFFYLPSNLGYVVVNAPIGAVISTLPRLHHILHWRNKPYFVVGNTFYRHHPKGYIVVEDPGFGYWR